MADYFDIDQTEVSLSLWYVRSRFCASQNLDRTRDTGKQMNPKTFEEFLFWIIWSYTTFKELQFIEMISWEFSARSAAHTFNNSYECVYQQIFSQN